MERGRFWAYEKPFDRGHLENGKSQHYMSIGAKQQLGAVAPQRRSLLVWRVLCLADALVCLLM